jgi:hypothetical protein
MTRLVGCGAACALALAASLSAQTPQTNPPQTNPPQTNPPPTNPATTPRSPTYPQPAPTPASPAQGAAVTIEGCLYREVEVPGRNIPEAMWSRVNTDDDYVLADTRVVQGTAPTIAAKSGSTPTGTSGAAATPMMFKIDTAHKAKLELSKHSGKRVQIDGMLEHLDRASTEVSAAIDLVELKGTAIRPVAGECAKAQSK